MSRYHYIPTVEWDKPKSAVLCGAKGSGVNQVSSVTCTDCLALLRGGDTLHVPPIMNEHEDGIFLFADRHHGAGFTMEVVPQTTGNVEITLEDSNHSGQVFTLSHLDRMDLVRALLHDFHYSPERGGPNDDIN